MREIETVFVEGSPRLACDVAGSGELVVDFDATGGVILRFILEQDIAEDREEIEEIVFQFEAYQSSLVKVEVEVLVDDRPIHVVNPTVKGRAVYGRRELV